MENGMQPRKVPLLRRNVFIARQRHLPSPRVVVEKLFAVGKGSAPHVLIDQVEEFI